MRIFFRAAVQPACIERALEEMKKPFTPGRNVNHFKRLLEETQSIRRPWVEKQADGIAETLEKFPLLMDYELVRYLSILYFHICLLLLDS